MRITLLLHLLLLTTLVFWNNHYLIAQTASSKFEWDSLKYNGNKIEQTKLLLQTPMFRGWVKHGTPIIDQNFLKLITDSIRITKSKLKEYLQENHIDNSSVGGSIEKNIASIINPTNKHWKPVAYFIIHDVSYEESSQFKFPNNIDSISHRANQFNFWTTNQKRKGYFQANIFINRLGDSKTYVDFGKPCLTTKFERADTNKHFSLKGLYVGVELVQQRIRSRTNSMYFDQAPAPGFTNTQYARLALIYIVASVRKGEWLIPAYHIVIDEGINEAHDDPQKFELRNFTDAVLNISNEIKNKSENN